MDPKTVAKNWLDKLTPDERYEALRAATYLDECELDALKLFRATPAQSAIFRTKAPVVIVRGGVRAGKSLCSFAAFASAATGIPLLDEHGEPLPPFIDRKPPLLLWTIGWGEKHIGQTIYRLLFKPGAFKIIRDESDGHWRRYLPELDERRKRDAQPAPPFIPERLIKPKGWAWANRAARVFDSCEMTNDSLVYAYTSTGEPKQGDKPDMILVDEDTARPASVPEWISRLEEPWARMIWPAFPHSRNEALQSLSRKAEEDIKSDDPTCQEVLLTYSGNPFIDSKVKKQRIALWHATGGDDAVRSRDRGEFLTDSLVIYPTFSYELHSTPCEQGAAGDDAVDKILRECGGVPPKEWSRDMIIDPGSTMPGILFCAVPPPSLGVNCGVVYRALTLQDTGPDDQAAFIKEHAVGQIFERFIMDDHGSRGRGTGLQTGETGRIKYSQAFEKQALTCARTGSTFMPSSANKMADIIEVQRRLAPDPANRKMRPWLRFVRAYTEDAMRQMEAYRKKRDKDGFILDEPEYRQPSCWVDCVRYWVASKPEWAPVTQWLDADDTSTTGRYRKLFGEKKDKVNSMWIGQPRPSADEDEIENEGPVFKFAVS